MKRSAYLAGHRLNPVTTEKFPTGFRSGDTLPEADFDTPIQKQELGSVENGLSYKEPLWDDQPEYSTKKVYD